LADTCDPDVPLARDIFGEKIHRRKAVHQVVIAQRWESSHRDVITIGMESPVCGPRGNDEAPTEGETQNQRRLGMRLTIGIVENVACGDDVTMGGAETQRIVLKRDAQEESGAPGSLVRLGGRNIWIDKHHGAEILIGTRGTMVGLHG